MNPAQEKSALALVAATLSRDGFQKAMAIVDADEVLEQRARPARSPTSAVRFGRAEFYVGILGKPSTTSPWMLQFGGHHLAINVTLAGRRERPHADAHWHPAGQLHPGRANGPAAWGRERQGVRARQRLNPDQQKQAVLGYDVRNIVLGPGTDGKTIAPEGILGSALTPAQRTMLVDLAREWVEILGEEAAAARMKEVQAGLDQTYFAWAGPTTNGQGAYFRIQGPTVLIEYAPQGKGEAATDHIHTIYRDPTNDYAAKAAAK